MTPRTLDPADYWKLRAICTDAQRAQDLALAALQRQKACLQSLGLDPARNFKLDDDTLTVTVAGDETP